MEMCKYNRTSFYASDTYRKDRLTLNWDSVWIIKTVIVRLPVFLELPGGFDVFVGPLEYSGNDLSPSFTDVSPRLGATYDITGDGKDSHSRKLRPLL